MGSHKDEREIKSLKRIITDRDKRIIELEAEIKVMMKMLKGRIK
jgi:hypothetical protein